LQSNLTDPSLRSGFRQRTPGSLTLRLTPAKRLKLAFYR